MAPVLTDDGIRDAVTAGELDITPFGENSLQGASYDFRVGDEAFISGSDAVVNVAQRGLVVIEPGEFALVATLERVHCGAQVAGQLGLCSAHARHGLMLLSGPQIDPGFDGVLVVRITNLAPRRITLPHGSPFLTTQFFRLDKPVSQPYSGSRQGQKGLNPKDISELNHGEGLTIGGMVNTLASLAKDVNGVNLSVARLEGSVARLSWLVPLLVAIGMAVVGIIVVIK